MLDLTTEQQAKLLVKALREPRRNQKRFLRDLGGDGSAEELDAQLSAAQANKRAVSQAKQLDRQRAITASTIEAGLIGGSAEMLAAVRVQMDRLGMTQAEVAAACGWTQPMVSKYLAGEKEPGLSNLVKLAAAVGCKWTLTAK